MIPLTLYSKTDCHLCDTAHQLLTSMGLTVSVIDIQAHADLMAKYNLIIPVVIFNNGDELAWPFDTQAIRSQMERR
jgi:glutaredoxin